MLLEKEEISLSVTVSQQVETQNKVVYMTIEVIEVIIPRALAVMFIILTVAVILPEIRGIVEILIRQDIRREETTVQMLLQA